MFPVFDLQTVNMTSWSFPFSLVLHKGLISKLHYQELLCVSTLFVYVDICCSSRVAMGLFAASLWNSLFGSQFSLGRLPSSCIKCWKPWNSFIQLHNYVCLFYKFPVKNIKVQRCNMTKYERVCVIENII